jgi:hypothetical protein
MEFSQVQNANFVVFTVLPMGIEIIEEGWMVFC